MKLLIHRLVLIVLGLLVLGIGAGAIHERRARQAVLAQYPPPGKLVDVGGRQMQIDCRGTGAPVVVFEAGRDLRGSLSWYLVHDRVAAFTRACAYSRAGILWSEPKSSLPTVTGAADDLHAALAAAGERGPFVLVGHSAGGLAILVYTKQYPAEVSGLVFVDSSHPQQFERLAAVGVLPPSIGPGARLARAFAWAGAARLWTPLPPEDSSEAMGIVSAFSPWSWVGATREVDEDEEWFREAGTVRTLGSRPVVVLSGMTPRAEALGISPEQEEKRLQLWRDMQSELAALSTASLHQEDPDADHYLQTSRPDEVVASIKRVVDSLR